MPYDIIHRIIKKPDGEVRYVHEKCEHTRDENGRIILSTGTVQDITERKKAEEDLRKLNEGLEQRVSARTADLQKTGIELQGSQHALMNIVEDLNQKTDELEQANIKLKELDRLKSMFISSMSHELRTPLNSIIGFSSILLNGWIGPINDEQKQNLSTILKAGKHLLTLINDVIDVSKIEAGIIDIRIEEFDLNDMLAEAVELIEKEAKDRGLELKIGPVHQLMCTDRRRLLQCVINLLSNAVKFTDKGFVRITAQRVKGQVASSKGQETKDLGAPTVGAEASSEGQGAREEKDRGSRIEGHGEERSSLLLATCYLTLDGDFIEISVSDTGIGIKEEDMEKLFQPFVRLDSPLRGTVSGTGLGLYLTKKLVVDILKGDIICHSRYGEGSCFTIKIPVRI